MRLSPDAFQFIEDNGLALVAPLLGTLDLGGAGISPDLVVSVPRVTVNENQCVQDGPFGSCLLRVNATVDVCRVPNTCFLDIDIANLQVVPTVANATRPNRIVVTLDASFRSENAAGNPGNLPVETDVRVTAVGIPIPINLTCTVAINSANQAPNAVGVRAEVAIVEADEAVGTSREGYGKLEIVEIALSPGAQASDIAVNCRFDNAIANALLSGLTNGIIAQILPEITTVVNESADQIVQQVANLCQVALPDPTNNNARTLCPTGSTANSAGVCINDSNGTCLPLLLGAEARLDMGDFLSAISPGLRAAIDILVAVQGEGEVLANGYTLNLFGGFDSGSISSCVPDGATHPDIPSVTLADAFRGGGDDNHISIGLSEEVMNYGAHELWLSGALCLQVTTRLDQLLSTGLFSLLIRSLNNLAFPGNGAALGIALRPQQAPVVTLGAGTQEDPFVTLALPELALDFYVWSTERYVRFMTFTSDVVVGLNLPLVDGAITPEIVGVDLANSSVSNSDLIREDPATVTRAVESVVPLALGMLGGVIPTISITELLAGAGLPVTLAFPDDGLRLVESDGERFLGVFLDLALPPATPFTQRTDTTVELVAVNVPDSTVFDINALGVGERPSVEIAMAASGPEGVEFEYQHRVDGQIWSEWSRSPYAVISHDSLLLQGRHSVEARARAVGGTTSTDFTPARAEFLIDVLAPTVEAIRMDNGTTLRASDAVSYAEELEFRYRELGSEDWTEWTALGTPERQLAEAVGQLEFQVRDEAGNIGSNAEALRGLPPPSDGAGCGDCSTGEGDASRPLYGLLSLLALGLLLRRKRES